MSRNSIEINGDIGGNTPTILTPRTTTPRSPRSPRSPVSTQSTNLSNLSTNNMTTTTMTNVSSFEIHNENKRNAVLIFDFENGILIDNKKLKNEIVSKLTIDQILNMKYNQIAKYFGGEMRIDKLESQIQSLIKQNIHLFLISKHIPIAKLKAILERLDYIPYFDSDSNNDYNSNYNYNTSPGAVSVSRQNHDIIQDITQLKHEYKSDDTISTMVSVDSHNLDNTNNDNIDDSEIIQGIVGCDSDMITHTNGNFDQIIEYTQNHIFPILFKSSDSSNNKNNDMNDVNNIYGESKRIENDFDDYDDDNDENSSIIYIATSNQKIIISKTSNTNNYNTTTPSSSRIKRQSFSIHRKHKKKRPNSNEKHNKNNNNNNNNNNNYNNDDDYNYNSYNNNSNTSNNSNNSSNNDNEVIFIVLSKDGLITQKDMTQIRLTMSLTTTIKKDNNNRGTPTMAEKLIINRLTYFSSDTIHRLNILHIKRGGILTVDAWNDETNKGGTLKIHCKQLILDSGSCIDLTGRGYSGGKLGGYQGCSYKNNVSNKPIQSNFANYGGGGGGTGDNGPFSCGGGGGYATQGFNFGSVKGGDIYGNKQLFTVYLGSGGGGGGKNVIGYAGTNGGGAIVIECEQSIVISRNSCIIANGANNMKNYFACGCGSGGSIYLKAPKIINNGKIEAVGGKNIHSHDRFGNGGNGRIRVDCNKDCHESIQKSMIYPEIGFLRLI